MSQSPSMTHISGCLLHGAPKRANALQIMQEIEDRSTDWYFFLGFNTIIRQKGSKNGTLCGFGDSISITRDLYIQLADKLRGGYQNEQNLITLRLRRTTHPSGVWKGKGKVGLAL